MFRRGSKSDHSKKDFIITVCSRFPKIGSVQDYLDIQETVLNISFESVGPKLTTDRGISNSIINTNLLLVTSPS